MVSRAQTVFNQDGTFADQKIEEQLRKYLEGFTAYVWAARQNRPAP